MSLTEKSANTSLYIALIWMLLPVLCYSQAWRTRPFSVAVYNNATLLPLKSFTAVFNQPLHPGLYLAYEFGWKETIKSPIFRNINTTALGGNKVNTGKWFQSVAIGWQYHQFVNHAFTLTTTAGYRRYIRKFSAEASLHAGYMHVILLTERAVRQMDGSWRISNGAGRPQFIAGAGIGAGYDAGTHNNIRRVFVNYDFRLQMPFVKSYVPILPNGLLSIGVQFSLYKNVNINKPSNGRLECPKD